MRERCKTGRKEWYFVAVVVTLCVEIFSCGNPPQRFVGSVQTLDTCTRYKCAGGFRSVQRRIDLDSFRARSPPARDLGTGC